MLIRDFIPKFEAEVDKVVRGLLFRKCDTTRPLSEEKLAGRKKAERTFIRNWAGKLQFDLIGLEIVPDEEAFKTLCIRIIGDKDIDLGVSEDAFGPLCNYQDAVEELLNLLSACRRNVVEERQTTVYDYFDKSCFDPSLEAILAPTEGTEGKVVILPPRGPQPS